ncbi:hypothetical protein [Catenulispora rubra]|uniref:hypothetical protein n=1 Tax=Catenulispora rubra TaxID=280293 RepID=UPI0018924D54|nr:hypothetical protein [Catenulispora rubra]
MPTTPAGVEICALAFFLGVRAVALLQLAVALPTALRDTTSPTLFIALLTGYAAESAVLATATVRARCYRSRAWGWADAVVAVAVLLAQPAFITRADATGSWTAWGFALTLDSAAGAAIVFRRRREVVAAVAPLSGVYLATMFPVAIGASARITVVSNTFAYVGFAVLARLLVGYLRRLALDAEIARDAAAAGAAQGARLRHLQAQRLLLHDNIGLLRLLAQPDLPPELAGPLRGQALELANRVRRFLDDLHTEPAPRPPAGPGGPVPLTDAVYAAVDGFGDLPLELSVDLAADVHVVPAAAAALTGALATLLANVRLHADARLVVVHADADELAGWWEVTVHDDGRGFDPAVTPLGFGLREQVTGVLTRHDVSTLIGSEPGDGTSVTLRGPWTERGRS